MTEPTQKQPTGELAGLAAIVTGSARNIGRAIALRLAKDGAQVVVNDVIPRRSEQPGWAGLPDVVAEIEALGGAALAVIADVSDAGDVKRMVGDAVDRFGQIDILVNNAGYGHHRSFLEWDVADMERMLRVNFLGTLYFTKALLPQMVERGKGWLVFIASVAGRIASPEESAYTASKFALEAFTESLAQEVKGCGIQVALVEPGIIDTPMATTGLPQYDEKTVYPHGRRIQSFFTNPGKPEAAPALVREMIRYVIESDDPRLRFPVGPDALPFLGWRLALSDEDWVGLGGLERDADYYQRVFTDTGVDLRST